MSARWWSCQIERVLQEAFAKGLNKYRTNPIHPTFGSAYSLNPASS